MARADLTTAKINLTIAKEAVAQAEKRLSDTLETKKAFEQKATTLLGAFVTISLALSGAGAAFLQNESLLLHHHWPVWLAATLMFLGAVCFAASMVDMDYGTLGSDPGQWLEAGIIDAQTTDTDAQLAYMLAVLASFYEGRIAACMKSNSIKAQRIRWGIAVGVAAPFVLLGLFLPS